MITINLDQAKTISHDMRRQRRAEEFKPLDEVIMKQIPGTDVQQVEQQRQLIRDKYAAIQTEIDDAADVDTLKSILDNI